MKKWICLAMTAMLLFSGCSAGASSATAVEEESQQAEETQNSVDEETAKYTASLLQTTENMPQLEPIQSGDQVATITTSE